MYGVGGTRALADPVPAGRLPVPRDGAHHRGRRRLERVDRRRDALRRAERRSRPSVSAPSSRRRHARGELPAPRRRGPHDVARARPHQPHGLAAALAHGRDEVRSQPMSARPAPSPVPPIAALRGVDKVFEDEGGRSRVILKGVDFEVRPNEVVADPRPVRLREVDAPAHPHRPDPADVGDRRAARQAARRHPSRAPRSSSRTSRSSRGSRSRRTCAWASRAARPGSPTPTRA